MNLWQLIRVQSVSISMSLAIGCSRHLDVLPNSVPVRGTVKLDGKPLPNGTVMFVPLEGEAGQIALGKIHEGRFDMITTMSSPGVVMGKYGVRIESLNESQASQQGQAIGEGTPLLRLIPDRYTNHQTSGLNVEVTKGMPSVHLELQSR